MVITLKPLSVWLWFTWLIDCLIHLVLIDCLSSFKLKFSSFLV
jgi:hypothetical protein